MPYATNEELPLGVRRHLPPGAQDLYRQTFNHAASQYGGPESDAAHLAWAVVKRRYMRHVAIWEPKEMAHEVALTTR